MCCLSFPKAFPLSWPWPVLTPLVSASPPSLEPHFLSKLVGSWVWELLLFSTLCPFGLRENWQQGAHVCGAQARPFPLQTGRPRRRADIQDVFLPREHVCSQAWCLVGCFASCVCRKEKGEGLDVLLGMDRVYALSPWSWLTSFFLSFYTPQGKLASFFLSRVDALSPQLQQVKEQEADLVLSLILSISLLLLFGPCSHVPPC